MASLSSVIDARPKTEQHSVQFYPSEAARIRSIAKYLTDGIQNEECVLLICSMESREHVMNAVGNRFSPSDLQRIHFIEAQWVVENVLADGVVSGELFRTHIVSKVRALVRQHGELRIYGDIGDAFAAEGNSQAVLDLEVEWHKTMDEVTFRLHCGYMMENFSSFESTPLFEEICAMHSKIEDEYESAHASENAAHALGISRARILQQQNAIQRETLAKDRLIALGEMSAAVSQELNSPLASILFSADNIRSWMATQDFSAEQINQLTEHIRRTETSALRMVSINNGLRAFTQKATERLETFSLQTAVLQTIDLLVVRLTRSKIHFNVKLHSSQEQLLLYGSSAGIEQVILNLLSNAIDSILEKRRSLDNPDTVGSINISLLRTGPTTAELVIQDDGLGITDANQTRIFEPFFTTKCDTSGSGLGLSLSEKTVSHHGGRLTCETIPGESATFKCTLPVTVR